MVSDGDNFLDNDKADEEQDVDQQIGDEQLIDYHHHHFSANEKLHDEPPNESTSFINLLDTTLGSSNVILTYTSTVKDDVTKIFWKRLAGI